MAKHTESLEGAAQIFSHTMLSNLHPADGAESARRRQLAAAYCTQDMKYLLSYARIQLLFTFSRRDIEDRAKQLENKVMSGESCQRCDEV